MHKQLEDYLAEMARQIGSIPKPRRDEELKEMRAHLVHAVANALDAFGTPAEAALSVVKAWRCFTRKHGVKTFWQMLGFQSAFYVFMILFLSPKASDVHIFSGCWAFAVVVFVVSILGPHYLASQSDYRRLIALTVRR